MTGMSTFQALLIEYGSQDIPLDIVAQKYLGMGPAKAKERAALQQLPFPTYRGGTSRKSTRLVRAQDLAQFLDQQYQGARRDWEQMHG